MSDLVKADQEQFLPALSMQQAVERFNAVAEFARTVLRPDIDYGIIPGTNKPTLLKPGAEKLTSFFGLSVRMQLLDRVEDWTGVDHGGEPFFYYLYRCQLWRADLLIAEEDGSCNSWEKKYRYRQQSRLCPACAQETIIKGKAEFGGGWLCFAKKGGCGAKFRDGDPAIEGQAVGLVPNPDIFDQVNTMQKIAQKRALIAAVLVGVNASEFFTQDLEDLFAEAEAPAQPDTAGLLDLLRQARAHVSALGGRPRDLGTVAAVRAMPAAALLREISETLAQIAALARNAA